MSGEYTRYEVGSDGKPVLVTRTSSGRRVGTIPVSYKRPTSSYSYPQYRTSPDTTSSTTYHHRPPHRHEDYSPVYPAHTRTVPSSAYSRAYPRSGATHHHGSRHPDQWRERDGYYERQRVQPPTAAVPPVNSAYPRRAPIILDARPEDIDMYHTEILHPRKASREPKVDRENGRKGKSKGKKTERDEGGSRKSKAKEWGKGREREKESVRPVRREKHTRRYSSECDSPPEPRARYPDNMQDIRNSEKDAYAGVSDEALTPTEVKEVYTEQMKVAMDLAELYAWKSLPTWKSQYATLEASDPKSPSFISDTRTIRTSFSKSFLDELYYQLRNMKKAEGGRDRAREDDLNTLSQCVVADLRKADELSVDEFANKFAKLDISRS